MTLVLGYLFLYGQTFLELQYVVHLLNQPIFDVWNACDGAPPRWQTGFQLLEINLS